MVVLSSVLFVATLPPLALGFACAPSGQKHQSVPRDTPCRKLFGVRCDARRAPADGEGGRAEAGGSPQAAARVPCPRRDSKRPKPARGSYPARAFATAPHDGRGSGLGWSAKKLRRSRPPPPLGRVVLFHKPYGVLSDVFDPAADAAAASSAGGGGGGGSSGRWSRGLGEFFEDRALQPAGRLDANSEGLLVLSDDGRLLSRLTNPASASASAPPSVTKRYWALVEGAPSEEALSTLRSGTMVLKGRRTRPCRVVLADVAAANAWPPRDPPLALPACQGGHTWLELDLREGAKRQVRRMAAHVGHPVARLVRTSLRLDAAPSGQQTAAAILTDGGGGGAQEMGANGANGVEELCFALTLLGLAVGEWREATEKERRCLAALIDAPPG